MTLTTLRRALLAAAFLFLPQWVAAQIPVPPIKTRVTDLTNTLTPDQRAALEAKLATFETKKGSQVALLIVPTTQPEPIEQYSLRVVEQWKLGRKRVDDGVLLIIAKDDRKMRIEVGRGLEGAIPDVIAKRIVSEVIAPRFREGDFYGGITAGLDRILRTIEGEPLPPPKPAAQPGQVDGWLAPFIIAVIFATVVGGFLRAIFGRFLGAGIVGFAAGVLGYFFMGVVAAAIIAIIAFLINLFSGSALSHGSGWGGGWSSGGGGGNWSSDGGGFSGGGGDFGGGGASGSW
jgi:uncharacterized protein